jgi:DNA-binding MarR family transcriptional regulator
MHVDASSLERLDAALGGLRRVWEAPAVKRRFLELVGRPLELSVLRTLRAIEQITGEPAVRDVAELLQIDGSTASRFVDQAVAAGYLTRHTSARDKRCCVLALTDTGLALLEDARRARGALLEELTHGWDGHDVEILSALLERLALAVQRVQAPKTTADGATT